MLMNMAVDLGLNSNTAMAITMEDQKKKATWNAVLRLHNFVRVWTFCHVCIHTFSSTRIDISRMVRHDTRAERHDEGLNHDFDR